MGNLTSLLLLMLLNLPKMKSLLLTGRKIMLSVCACMHYRSDDPLFKLYAFN